MCPLMSPPVPGSDGCVGRPTRRRDDPGRRRAAQPVTGPGGGLWTSSWPSCMDVTLSSRRAGNAGGLRRHALGADKLPNHPCLAPCFALGCLLLACPQRLQEGMGPSGANTAPGSSVTLCKWLLYWVNILSFLLFGGLCSQITKETARRAAPPRTGPRDEKKEFTQVEHFQMQSKQPRAHPAPHPTPVQLSHGATVPLP